MSKPIIFISMTIKKILSLIITKKIYPSSWKYASIPDVIITHPYEKHKICFVQSISTISPTILPSHQLPPKSCTNNNKTFPHLIMIICFNPHTIITHPLAMTLILQTPSPTNASHIFNISLTPLPCRRIPGKSCTDNQKRV